MAVRHACQLDHRYPHDSGDGRAPRKACRHCGAPLREEHGVYGVFVWRGDGRYPPEDARLTRCTRKAAERQLADGEVVRWLVDPPPRKPHADEVADRIVAARLTNGGW